MKATLIYDGGPLHLPQLTPTPKQGQLVGSGLERLVEYVGRMLLGDPRQELGAGRESFTHTCPQCGGLVQLELPPMTPEQQARWGDSHRFGREDAPLPTRCPKCKGTGMLTGFHEWLLEEKRWEAHQHAYLTVETELDPWPFWGVPGVVVRRVPAKIVESESYFRGEDEPVTKEPSTGNEPQDDWLYRVTFSLRHLLEWPNKTVEGWLAKGEDEAHQCHVWGEIMAAAVREVCPRLLPGGTSEELPQWRVVEPDHPSEQMVTVEIIAPLFSLLRFPRIGEATTPTIYYTGPRHSYATWREVPPHVEQLLGENRMTNGTKQLLDDYSKACSQLTRAFSAGVSQMQSWLERSGDKPGEANLRAVHNMESWLTTSGTLHRMFVTASFEEWSGLALFIERGLGVGHLIAELLAEITKSRFAK